MRRPGPADGSRCCGSRQTSRRGFGVRYPRTQCRMRSSRAEGAATSQSVIAWSWRHRLVVENVNVASTAPPRQRRAAISPSLAPEGGGSTTDGPTHRGAARQVRPHGRVRHVATRSRVGADLRGEGVPPRLRRMVMTSAPAAPRPSQANANSTGADPGVHSSFLQTLRGSTMDRHAVPAPLGRRDPAHGPARRPRGDAAGGGHDRGAARRVLAVAALGRREALSHRHRAGLAGRPPRCGGIALLAFTRSRQDRAAQ